MTEKIVLTAVDGSDRPGFTTIPFVIATAIQASGFDAKRGSRQVAFSWQVKKLMRGFRQSVSHQLSIFLHLFRSWRQILLCYPCNSARDIGPTDLIESVGVINAVTFIPVCTEATSTLVYRLKLGGLSWQIN